MLYKKFMSGFATKLVEKLSGFKDTRISEFLKSEIITLCLWGGHQGLKNVTLSNITFCLGTVSTEEFLLTLVECTREGDEYLRVREKHFFFLSFND